MKLQSIAKLLSNRINQEHYVLHYLQQVYNAGFKKGKNLPPPAVKNPNDIQEIISDEEIQEAWGYADFGEGNNDKRKIIYQSLYQRAEGWHTGYTITCIMTSLGLLQKMREDAYYPTRKGVDYLIRYSEKYQPKSVK